MNQSSDGRGSGRRTALKLFGGAGLGAAASPLLSTPAVAAATIVSAAAAETTASLWAESWSAASSDAQGLPDQDYTFRNVVHLNLGGTALRVRVTNEFGTAPLTVGDASVAIPDGPVRASVVPGTLRQLTFAGSPAVTLAAGQDMWSDPVALSVRPDSSILVSVFVPGNPTGYTIHRYATQTCFYSVGADHALSTSSSDLPSQTPTWFLIRAVEVCQQGPGVQGAVVAFGDSITDGMGSTPDASDRYPDLLARRLLARPNGQRLTAVNAGLGGNMLLKDGRYGGPSGLKRFQSDALSVRGVRAVILMEGINDINAGATAQQLIAGYEEVIQQAKSQQVELLGATITPFSFTGSKEQVRTTVNNWILTSGTFAHVVDIDAFVADPGNPSKLIPQFASTLPLPANPDHPNDAGYAAIAEAISNHLPSSLLVPNR